jgi:Cu(I)/Ag(I) efflux system protein CusF
MHKVMINLIAALTLSFASLTGVAQSTMVDGEVKKVDESSGKVTIKHGPIPSMNMEDGMTMVFRAQNPSMLKGIKQGDRIRFEPANINGQYTVTKLEKKKK